MENEKQEKPSEVKKSKSKNITPKRDFAFSFNGKDYDLKKGESVEIDPIFLPNLKTEKVI
jgi:hypothetical protein